MEFLRLQTNAPNQHPKPAHNDAAADPRGAKNYITYL
jgi:hypothetical protein